MALDVFSNHYTMLECPKHFSESYYFIDGLNGSQNWVVIISHSIRGESSDSNLVIWILSFMVPSASIGWTTHKGTGGFLRENECKELNRKF